MECPDLFPLGDSGKWVLIGSLYKTNQWWVGSMAGKPRQALPLPHSFLHTKLRSRCGAGDPPRFTPDNVGIVDYGNGYAAKVSG